jgi:hypothetical protein
MYFIVNAVICYHVIIILDATIGIKYMFIFHLKNPTAVQDDFWKFLINLWTFMFFLLSEIVMNTLPGRDVPRISICIGTIPLQDLTAPYKFGVHFVVVLVLTLLIHIGFHSLRITYRVFGFQKFQEYKTYKIQFLGTNKDTLFSFVTTFVALILFLFAHIFSYIISYLHPSDLDVYPNYIMEFSLENVIPSGAILLFLITHLYNNDQVRRAVWNKIQGIISC